jgi:hypothetical protein
MNELVFFLEEESAKALLQILLPRLLPAGRAIQTRFVVFEGKGDLTRQLERKLRGYQNPKARFIVLRDQDTDDCAKIKRELIRLSARAGKPRTAVTIACREIEAFYLGDLLAVETGLNIPHIARQQHRARFRNPDSVETPARVLETLTRHRYHKVSGSRAIAPHLNIDAPRSASFRYLIHAIQSALDLAPILFT